MCEGNLVLLTPSGQTEAKQFAGVGRRQTNTYTTTTATATARQAERAGGRAEVSAKSLKGNPGLAPSHANRMH